MEYSSHDSLIFSCQESTCDYETINVKFNYNTQAIADFMPPRLYGQLAVHIHMATLRRVKLFEVWIEAFFLSLQK